MLLNMFNINLNFIDGSGALWGTEGNDLIVARESEKTDRLEGGDGEDILIGSSGKDILNAGAGDGFIFAENGSDKIYIDRTSNGEEVQVNLRDTDDATDVVIFGHDYKAYGSEPLLGTTFVTLKGFEQEDKLVLRGLIGPDDYHYTIPTQEDLLVYVAHNDALSVIRIEDYVGGEIVD